MKSRGADGCSIHGLSDGTWSLIDAVEELLERCGPSDVTISTWTAANADIERAEGLLQDGRIKTLRLLVDRSFESRQPLVAAQIVKRPDLEIDTAAAETFATTVPALRERLAAARKLHVDAVSEAEAAARAKVRAKHAALASRVRSLPENAPVPSYLAQQDRATSTTRRARDLADDLERGKLELTDEAFADLERSVTHQENRCAPSRLAS